MGVQPHRATTIMAEKVTQELQASAVGAAHSADRISAKAVHTC